MLRIIALISFAAITTFALMLTPRDAEGCAAAPRPGDYVRIAEESAIIIWDPVKKIEHFIRRAAFDTKSPDFGFLVPTPTVPILKEVEDDIFREMDKWIVPKDVQRNRFRFEPILCCCLTAGDKSARKSMSGNSVRILGEQEVGGFKTAILEADNTDDLGKWLKENGYSNDPELQSWLVPYVANKWKITAFKIMQDPKTGKLATTKPVRMSFATDKPFFPYREPEVKDKKQNDGSRLLRVLFVSTERMNANLGNAKWHADVPWSDQLTDEQRTQLARETGVAEDEIPAKAWLTTFEDRASPRPGTEEVYFVPSPNQTPIRPEWIHYNDVWIPLDVVLFGLLFTFLVGWVVKRAVASRRKIWASCRASQPPLWSAS